MPPLGRISNFSSLRKHRPAEHHLQDAWFDRAEAQPRFVIKPFSCTCEEGGSATFYCRVLAASPPIVTWHRDNLELKQSVKYMKKYNDNDYALTINRVRADDRGEYIVRAKNSYGSKEEVVFLTVHSKQIVIQALYQCHKLQNSPNLICQCRWNRRVERHRWPKYPSFKKRSQRQSSHSTYDQD
jgi:hypothetical protein